MPADESSRTKTSIVILNWNQPELTRRCLSSVAALADQDFDILVIDNGSNPDNFDLLQEICRGRCRLLRLDHNRGFAGGMNFGIQDALQRGFEFVWLLNNDAFPESGSLGFLVQAMEREPQLAAVTPRIYGSDGQEQHVGARLNWYTGENRELSAQQMSPSAGRNCWLTGAALFLRASALKWVGGFDEKFFAYWEDVDLCFRFRRKGFGLRAVPEAACLHLGGGSSEGVRSPFVFHMVARNGFIFLRKHLSSVRFVVIALRYSEYALKTNYCYHATRPEAFSAVLGGLWAAVTGRSGMPATLYGPAWLEKALTARPWRFVKRNRTPVVSSGPVPVENRIA
jgi:GT2 family glycosyltransferase